METQKAIIYIRVSTDEQKEKGFSLGLQTDLTYKYCEQMNYEVIGFYQEDYSAKTFNRPEWQKMMKLIRTRKLQPDWIIFQKWDRFSRNASQAYQVIDELESRDIRVQATDQPLDLTIPDQRLLLAVYLALPEIDNRKKSITVAENMRKAKKLGKWMATAPKGYKNFTDASGKIKSIVPNDDAPLVKWCFEQLSTGLVTVIDILRKA